MAAMPMADAGLCLNEDITCVKRPRHRNVLHSRLSMSFARYQLDFCHLDDPREDVEAAEPRRGADDGRCCCMRSEHELLERLERVADAALARSDSSLALVSGVLAADAEAAAAAANEAAVGVALDSSLAILLSFA